LRGASEHERKDLDVVSVGHLGQKTQDDRVDLFAGAKEVLLVEGAVGDKVDGLFLLAADRACSIVEDS
jgi:Ni,Fe-hydrogenase I small subunit